MVDLLPMTFCETGIIISILYMRKLQLRVLKSLAHCQEQVIDPVRKS